MPAHRPIRIWRKFNTNMTSAGGIFPPAHSFAVFFLHRRLAMHDYPQSYIHCFPPAVVNPLRLSRTLHNFSQYFLCIKHNSYGKPSDLGLKMMKFQKAGKNSFLSSFLCYNGSRKGIL